MTTGLPDRRPSPPRRGSRPLGALIGACVIAGTAAIPLGPLREACARTAPRTDSAAATPLERIDYRREGEVRQAIGEVHLSGERVRLRLFSAELAHHYEVWVDLADFIGATPLPAEESARVRAERDAAATARRAEREVARARRAAEKEAARARAEGARESRAGGSRDPRAATDVAMVPPGATRVPGSSPAPATVAELNALADAIGKRREDAAQRVAALLATVAERLPAARASLRPLRELAGRLEDEELALEKVGTALAGRRRMIARVEEESAEGSLRGGELSEQIGFVGGQISKLGAELELAESALAKSAAELAAIAREAAIATEPVEATSAPGEPSGAQSSAQSSAQAARPAPPPRATSSGSVSASAPAARSEVSPTAAASPAAPVIPAVEPARSAWERSPPTTPEERAEPAKGREGGFPDWILYPVAALSLYLLWRGSRPRAGAPAAPASRGPERPERAPAPRAATRGR